MGVAPSRNDAVTIGPPRGPSGLPGNPIVCPICGRSFAPVGRQRVCSAACRQTLWRRRHPRSLPAMPARVPRAATVYVCGACGTRYLGEQWCPDCQRPCRRLGPGGPCPQCDEPVALSDLLPDLEEGGEAGRCR